MGNSLFVQKKIPMRSNYCGALRNEHINSKVQLCGWVDRCRDHGGVIFIDLRDSSGTMQITVDPDQGTDLFNIAESLKNETVIQVTGKVRSRPEESINKKLETGQIEVLADVLKVLNPVYGNLPFAVSVHDDEPLKEEIRLKHRYLDLRRERMKKKSSFKTCHNSNSSKFP